jgi:hypothetical protein
MRINENLLERPSRIRYHKTYGDLKIDAIREIIEDLLVDKSFAAEIEAYVSQLEIITLDIVKEVIREVNMHGEGPTAFQEIFNARKAPNSFHITELVEADGKVTEARLFSHVAIDPVKITMDCVGDEFEVNNRGMGIIEEVIAEDLIKVKWYYGKPNELKTIRLDTVSFMHKSFVF